MKHGKEKGKIRTTKEKNERTLKKESKKKQHTSDKT